VSARSSTHVTSRNDVAVSDERSLVIWETLVLLMSLAWNSNVVSNGIPLAAKSRVYIGGQNKCLKSNRTCFHLSEC